MILKFNVETNFGKTVTPIDYLVDLISPKPRNEEDDAFSVELMRNVLKRKRT